jgi:hypothetical protein
MTACWNPENPFVFDNPVPLSFDVTCPVRYDGVMTPTPKKVFDRLSVLPTGKVLDAACKIQGMAALSWESPDPLLLALACLADEVDFVRQLLEKTPGLANTPCVSWPMLDVFSSSQYFGGRIYGTFNGMPPLSAAVSHGASRTVEYLLSRPDVHVQSWHSTNSERESSRDWCALFQATSMADAKENLASARPFVRMANLLLKLGADPFEADDDGCSPFSMAILEIGNTQDSDDIGKLWAVLGIFVPFLSDLGTRPAHEEAMEEILLQLKSIDHKNAHVHHRWLKKKTGINLPSVGQVVMAFLLEQGLTHPACVEVARTHFPDALVHVEKKALTSALPLPVTRVPRKVSRL